LQDYLFKHIEEYPKLRPCLDAIAQEDEGLQIRLSCHKVCLPSLPSKYQGQNIRILVITSCTGEKRSHPENQLTLADFQSKTRLRMREVELADFACPASEMYTGQQHLRTMEGVTLLRQSFFKVDVMILSAGYGLIPEDKEIVPYEVSFSGMSKSQIDTWGITLGVHSALERVITNYDLVFFLLGEHYLRSLRLPVVSHPQQTLIFLTSKAGARYVQGLEAKTFILPLSTADAKRHRYGLVGLKGFLFKWLAESVIKNPQFLKKIYDNPSDLQKIVTWI